MFSGVVLHPRFKRGVRRGLPDGRHRMFCCPVDIHSKRNTPIMRPKFLGTDDDWGKVTDANADEWYGEEPDPTPSTFQ